jgi:hypothetical protein
MSRPTILLLPLLALGQCAPAPPPVGQARADAETLAACREHANDVYNRTQRDSIYTITSRDTPYSAAYAPGVTGEALAQRYVHENMVRDCVRNTGIETSRSPGVADTP